jgi:hypothetical protein
MSYNLLNLNVFYQMNENINTSSHESLVLNCDLVNIMYVK